MKTSRRYVSYMTDITEIPKILRKISRKYMVTLYYKHNSTERKSMFFTDVKYMKIEKRL